MIDLISSWLSKEAAELEEAVQGPGGLYPLKPIMLHTSWTKVLYIPRGYLRSPPEKMPAQLIDYSAPRLFFSGDFSPTL